MRNTAISLVNIVICLGLFLAALGRSTVYSQDQGNEIPITDSVREAILKPLDGCRPSSKFLVQRHISKEGRFAMYGDIFGNGHIYAFTEFDNGTGFCERKNGHWIARKAWSIPVVWDTPIASDEHTGDVKPAKEAFVTLPFGGMNRIVLIASDVGKYHQDFYVLQFDADKNAPAFVGWTMKPPYRRAGYWILYNCSPRKAEWEKWSYYRVSHGQLIHVADWLEFVSVSNPDDQPTTISTYDSKGQLTDELKILDVQGATDGSTHTIMDTKTNSTYAKVGFRWRTKPDLDPDLAEAESAYLFGKLTRLPPALYPHDDSERYIHKLKKVESVKVEGDADAISRLSTGMHKAGK